MWRSSEGRAKRGEVGWVLMPVEGWKVVRIVARVGFWLRVADVRLRRYWAGVVRGMVRFENGHWGMGPS